MSNSNRHVDADRSHAGLLALLIFVGGLLAILISTLKPFDFQIYGLSLGGYIAGYDLPPSSFLDFPRNILLFMPFGFGQAALLDQRGWPKNRIRLAVVLSGFLLTLTVESLQNFLPFRQPSVADLLANTIGAAAGLACFRIWQNRHTATVWLNETLASAQNVTAVLAIYTLLLLFMAYGLGSSVRFYDWDAGYRMMLGNEQTGDRQWHGSVGDLMIFDRALDTAEARTLLENLDPALVVDKGLLAYYPLAGGAAERDATGQQPNLVWQGVEEAQAAAGAVQFGSGWLESESAVAGLSEALQSSSQLTIRVTVATADLEQAGPARIVSISEDPLLRNLTLGQEGSDLVLRYRSFLSGENGTTPQILFPAFFDGLEPLDLVITFDGLVIEMIDSHSELVNSVELVPGIAFYYRYIQPIVSMTPGLSEFTSGALTNWALHLLYYLVVFLPLGILLSLPSVAAWSRTSRLALVLCCFIVVPLLLELALVLPAGQGIRPLHAAAGVLVIVIITWVLIPFVRRASGR